MIVVFGSINVDIALPVPALPRPGETVLGEGYELSPGGKGTNQALAAARAGAEVALLGHVGRDGFAETALSLLRGVRSADAPTGLAAIGVDSRGDNQIIVASGANRLARAQDVPDTMLGPAAVVLMQLELPIAEVAALAPARPCARRARGSQRRAGRPQHRTMSCARWTCWRLTGSRPGCWPKPWGSSRPRLTRAPVRSAGPLS